MKNGTNKARAGFSADTIRRLTVYLRNLRNLEQAGVQVVSSREMARSLDISSPQVRKDLSYFGGFGRPGIGYRVKTLARELEKILGVNREWRIALVGVGRLGSALLEFPGFSQSLLRIVVAFDIDRSKVGRRKSGVLIEHAAKIGQILREQEISIGIICTTPDAAQPAADALIKAGARGILNFAPVNIMVPDDIRVSNVDVAAELEVLAYFIKR